MLLGRSYLSKSPTPLAAYNGLQAALMTRFLKRGGSVERWMEQFAPRFRQRYGWLCAEPCVVRETSHEELRYRPNPRLYRRY
jgi:hypothetical protein